MEEAGKMRLGLQEEAELADHFVPQEQLKCSGCCLPLSHLRKAEVRIVEDG